MIYIDTMTNAQFAAVLVSVVLGAAALYNTFYWLAKAVVDFFFPVEDEWMRKKRADFAKLDAKYKADMTDEQVRELTAERWSD